MNTVRKKKSDVISSKFIIFVLSLVFLTLTYVFYHAFFNIPKAGTPPISKILVERQLVFIPENKLIVSITDLDGNVLAVSNKNNNGFISVIYNAFERGRLKKRVKTNMPLNLRYYENGRLSLYDISTDLEIYLNSFGEKNANTFAKFLPDK
tara:strand:+ start:1253 stop:1705 length:453 start_codon:yes stop_codon:yes gene_type:complete